MDDVTGNAGRRDDGEERPPSPGRSPSAPRTPMLLWVIAFVLVALMVSWGVGRFGVRSSAEPGSAAPAGGGK